MTLTTSKRTEEDYFCLAFDPGETTGWAALSKSGDITDFGQVRGGAYGGFKDFPEDAGGLAAFLFQGERIPFKPQLVIYEGYKIYDYDLGHVRWSEVETAQVVGVIKAYAAMCGATTIKQWANILQAARGMTGLYTKGAHDDNHWADAVNHGLYGMMRRKLIGPAELRSKPDRNQDLKSRKATPKAFR